MSSAVAAAGAFVLSPASPGHADAVAYLTNVTLGPGYYFASADAALQYGYRLCDKVRRGEPYALILAAVKDDVGDPGEYQTAFLLNQAVNELCPAAIWQLRNSAAHHRAGGTS
ncbi:DUF732 domain-containing protein [Mycobacterium sp. SMC-18]|uniref:DUF732 domain-containing protein n=1 Tax=unclassified Mycobacterium TaxID=2642494 RepID=UPI00387723C1